MHYNRIRTGKKTCLRYGMLQEKKLKKLYLPNILNTYFIFRSHHVRRLTLGVGGGPEESKRFRDPQSSEHRASPRPLVWFMCFYLGHL